MAMAMDMTINRGLAQRAENADGRLLWWALLPLFVLVEGARRGVANAKHDDPSSTRRSWLVEAKSQASIATSYALMARSMLQ